MKTLSWPLFSALFISTACPALAQVTLETSTHKEYRQHKSGKMVYRGGNYEVDLWDGNGIYQAGCARAAYWTPNPGVCPLGATGFVTFGNLDANQLDTTPYLSIISVIPAVVIEPRRPDLCILTSAPASKLPRPAKDFVDDSYGVYYNLHTTQVREYVITRYNDRRKYGAKKRRSFEKQIVPGVYHYKFPRLDRPDLVAGVAAPVYGMPEGREKKRRRWYGVNFTNKNSWSKGGFMTLSIYKPNTITWQGIDYSNAYPNVDKLYFSLRYMKNEKSSRSRIIYVNPVGEGPASIFPAYVNEQDPRVLLKHVFVREFTLPPIFPGGMKGVIELEMDRAFPTGGVTYDFSTRRFQIPIVVINRYKEYAAQRFPNGGKNTGLLDDNDRDGYNNMTEWILDSLANDPASVPIPPVTGSHAEVLDPDFNFFVLEPQYFGFSVLLKDGTKPKVKQKLQRSTDFGKTWQTFKSDANWTVTRNFPDIKVESKVTIPDPDDAADTIQVQPPGTEFDIYRIKVTKKKKK